MDKSEGPLVSVLMTSYNREQYIAEAIESVLASTYTNFELIIVDDCSTDKTVSIAKKYERIDERVKVYVNQKNLRQFGNRNKAANYANGKFLKYFDSDDVMYRDCLEVMVDAFKKNENAGAVSQTNDPLVNEKREPCLYSPQESYLNHFFRGNPILFSGPSGSMFKKEVFLELGGFDENIGILADTVLMLKIAAKYPFVGVRNNLLYWRRHDEQVTIGQADWFEMIKQRFEINKNALNSKEFPLSNELKKIISRNIKNVLIRRILMRLIKKGNFSEFFKLVKICDLRLTDFMLAIIKNKKFTSLPN
ncbi:MAG: glycosyltransferase family 2 protein [Ginsengibacter sp.]